ncbi:XPG N-terminal domain-containing protein [Pelagophyceae sp. CCMP2097]|nr:XPG N-terminal domain-containing protein [Pelagophyceae sp. CCMP2097]
MGINNLWQLVSSSARRVSLETLEGTRLAIDVSIWLTQFVKAMRDDEGRPIPNAHIIGALRRIVKLLYYGIRPIFVFDGGVPAVKAKLVRPLASVVTAAPLPVCRTTTMDDSLCSV